MPAPARRLDPGITGGFVQVLDLGAGAAKVGAFGLIVGLGHAFPWVQATAVVRIAIPTVRHEFLHLIRIARVDGMDLVPVAIQDDATRELLGSVVVRHLLVGAIVRHVQGRESAAVEPARLLVERADREHVRDIDVVDELDHLADAGLDEVQPFHVDRRTLGPVPVDIDGAGHAAHHVVRVWVLAAEDGVHLHPLFLEIERLQIVGHGHEIGLGRQDVSRAAPVGIGEDPELAALHEALEPVLDVAEIAWRGQRMRG